MMGLWRALWLAGVIQLSLGEAQDTLSVTVTINTTRTVHLTDNRFLSLSVPPSFFLTDKYSAITKSMLQGLSPCYLRVGGPESDMLYFRSPTNVTEGTTFTMKQWEMLQELAVDSGVSIVFTANPHLRGPGSDNWDPSDTLALLQRSGEQGLRSTPIWQLGYVADMSKRVGSSVGQDVTRLRKALDLFPYYHSAAVLGPDFPSCISPECIRFLKDFLLQSGDVISSLVVQFKPESDQRDEEIAHEKISRLIDDVDKKIATRNVLKFNSYRNIPKKQIWIAETGAEEYTGVFTDALVWALRLGHTAKMGYDVLLRRLPQLDQPTPDYWVSLLYHQLVGRAVLDVRPSSHQSVMLFTHCTSPSYSSYKPGAVTTWGVNAAERGVSLKLPHPHTLLYALTAGSAHQTRSTLLNGEELQLTREAALPELRPHDLLADHISIPAFSVFYIVLPDLKAPACLSTTSLPRQNTISYVTKISSNADSLPKEPTFATRLLSDQNKYDVENGESFDSGDTKYKISDVHERNYNFQLIPTAQTITKKQENTREIKFKNPTQSSLIDHGPRNTLSKRKVFPFTNEITKEPRVENVVTDIRIKRSEFNKDQELSNYKEVETPSVDQRSTTKQHIKTFNVFTEFQDMYKNKDVEGLKNSQQGLLASKEGSNNQDFNNKEANTHYFPGEFYNKLRNFLSEPIERLNDIEDPHEAEASIAKYIPKDLVQGSKLKVTRKRPNTQTFDRKIVERSTEKMESYYNHVANIVNEDKCENKKHEGTMKCCMGKLSSTSSGHSHIETITKNRLKREIYSDQSNETPHSNQIDYLKTENKPLSDPLEEEKLSQLLEELTDEGEQLLKSFDQDYERTLLEHKLNSEMNLYGENLNVNDMIDSNVENNLIGNKVNKPKENFPTNNIFSSTSKGMETSTGKEVKLMGDLSSSTVSIHSVIPDIVKKDKQGESTLIRNKIDPEIKGNTNLNTVKESTSTLVEGNQLYTSDKNSSGPSPSSTNSSQQQRPTEQIQMDVLVVPKYSTYSGAYSTTKYQPTTFSTSILDENYQHDSKSDLNNSKSSVLNLQRNQIITSNSTTAIEKHDSKNNLTSEVLKLNKISFPQLKLLSHLDTNILSLPRLQHTDSRTLPRPIPTAHADNQLSISRPQLAPLNLRATNARKQRLEELRARLEKIKKRMRSLANRNTTNKNLFEGKISKNQSSANFPIGRTPYLLQLITPNLDEDSHKNKFAIKKEVTEKYWYANDNTFTKPPHDFSMINHLINSRREDIRKTNNTLLNLKSNSKQIDLTHTGEKYAEQKFVLPVKPLRNYLLTEDATSAKPDDTLPEHRVHQESNSETNAKLRGSRSIKNPCIRDRFNDFESDVQESRFQQHVNIQPPPNKQAEVKSLNNKYQINESKGDEKVEKNSSDTSKPLPSRDHLTKLKRSIDDNIQLLEVDSADILTNEIVKQRPLHVSSPDNNLIDGRSLEIKPNRSLVERLIELAKKHSKTNPSSLENFRNNFNENIDTTYESENNNLTTKIIEVANSDINKGSPELEDVSSHRVYDSVPTVKSNTGHSQDIGLGFQKTNTATGSSDILKNYFVSAIIEKVTRFFKNITSVINNLS